MQSPIRIFGISAVLAVWLAAWILAADPVRAMGSDVDEKLKSAVTAIEKKGLQRRH